jgi:hypothetical protein
MAGVAGGEFGVNVEPPLVLDGGAERWVRRGEPSCTTFREEGEFVARAGSGVVVKDGKEKGEEESENVPSPSIAGRVEAEVWRRAQTRT